MLHLLVKNLALLSVFGDTYRQLYYLISGTNIMLDWKKKLKFASIVCAFAILIIIVLVNVFKMTRVSEKDFKTYKQGLAYVEKKDFENAYYNFSGVSKNSALYEIALLRQGLCADELNDTETAMKKYKMFIEKYPDSIFVQKAYYALAQNYFRAKDYSRAEKTFHTIRKFFKDSEYKSASSYYLGIIYKEKAFAKIKEEQEKQKTINLQNNDISKNTTQPVTSVQLKDNKEISQLKQKSKIYFAEYLQEAPTGRLALNAADEMNKLQILLTQKDYYLLGRTYFKNGLYKKAYDCLNKSYMSSSWGYLSEIYRMRGDYKKYLQIFEHNYKLYSKNIEEEDLQTILQNYAVSYQGGEKEGWYSLLLLSHNNNAAGQDYIMYRLLRFEKADVQNDLYYKIYKMFPKGKYASDALANLFWSAYKNKNYKEAYNLGTEHIKNYPNTIASPGVIFWMGKLAERQGNQSEAKGFYQKVLDNYPDDYYAYRASRHINSPHNPNWKVKTSHRLPEKSPVIKFPLKLSGISEDNANLINTILKLNDYKLIGEIDKENKAIQSWINYKEGNFAIAAVLARDAIAEAEVKPDFSDGIYKLAYQLHYQEYINNSAKDFRLDPFLVTALIREESYFNPKAGSNVGARGLMQLMPSTASYIAQKNGIKYSGASSLYNPQKNIELGCAYLDYAKERLYENNLLAIASYNGGPNVVRKWKDTLEYKNFDEFIEHIPYPETREYVKKVYRSYWVYLNIYNKK